jgi:hypothetical protein
MSDLRVLVFDSGEMLVGEVIPQDSAAVIVLQNTLILLRGPNHFILTEYAPMVTETVLEFSVLKLRHPPLTPNVDILNEWNKRFGSGIQIATTAAKPRSILEH